MGLNAHTLSYLNLELPHSISNNPPIGTVCGSLSHSFEWKYCITKATDHGNKDVIFYFHGGGGSESDWIDTKNYTSVVRKIWQDTGRSEPTVIVVSIGDLWGLSDKIVSGKKSSSYGDFLLNALPDIEKNILKFSPAHRTALGESMGAVISLRNPNMFLKIALICPGVLRENIFSPDEMDDYIRTTGAQRSYSHKITELLNKNFDSEQQYKVIAPQSLMKSFKSVPTLKLFLSCGESDEFGFFQESKTFVDLAEMKNFDTTWKPVPGKHCSMDIIALAEFLIK